MTCGYQTWQKDGLWLRVTCLTTKSHILLTKQLREVTGQIRFIIYLFYLFILLSLYIYFTILFIYKIDRVMACEIKILTTV